MRCILLVSAALVLACLVSCGSCADRPSLVAIDSLILQAPDSACELLADYPEDSLTTANDRAYHALLTTIARYKAYRPATSDSTINIALSHYDHNGANPDHRMRSLLYKGCVMEELGEVEEAIEYYKRAESVCPCDNYYYMGYINLRKASLYQVSFSDSISLSIYNKALNFFQEAHDKHYEALCHNSIGMLYNNQAKYALAITNIKQGLSIAEEANDSATIFLGYNNLVLSYYNQNKYKEVITISEKLIKLCENNTLGRACYDMTSISYSKLGCLDSAEMFLKLAPKPLLAEDSISALRATAELLLAKNDLRGYIYNNDRAVEMSDSLLMNSNAEKIRQSEAKYDRAILDIAHLSKQRKLIFIIAVLSIVVIVVVFCVFIYRRREKYARMELEDAISQVSASRMELEQVLHENQNRLNELKSQEDQLLNMQELLHRMRETHNDELYHIEEQLVKTNQALDAAKQSIKIQDMTRSCFDDILRTVFYSGRYNSDKIIENDSILTMKPEFWMNLFELVSIKHNDFYARIETHGVVLNETEKKLIALSVANVPSAIIRRILDFKNIQTVSTRRQKLAKKITGRFSNFDEIFH